VESRKAVTGLPAGARAAIGNRIAAEDEVTTGPVAAMMATFGRAGPEPKAGDPIPPLWHGMFCTAKLAPDRLGADGMAADEPLLPSLPDYPRRRFGGARFEFPRPVRIGDRIRKESEIVSMTPKEGRDGWFLMAVVRHTITGPDGPAVIEENDIIFLPPGEPHASRGGGGGRKQLDLPEPVWSRTIDPDPVLMFRHSALTFNAHRIHYDRDYAKAHGEPGLLVQASLIARLMLELVHDECPDRGVANFGFRMAAPIHDTGPFTIAGRPSQDGADLWACGHDGRLAMRAGAGLSS
jgi:3-methylfumaryl-CoA hydratase